MVGLVALALLFYAGLLIVPSQPFLASGQPLEI
jgi:hypothetical protein